MDARLHAAIIKLDKESAVIIERYLSVLLRSGSGLFVPRPKFFLVCEDRRSYVGA